MAKQTIEALMKAFAGESQARNRYTFFASVAKKEGYEQISRIFTETAANEKEHAERFYKLMKQYGTDPLPFAVTITADFPVALGTTMENLLAAADGEREEHALLYPEFAKIARAEGFADVGAAFDFISTVEAHHEARYRKLADNIEKGIVFARPESTEWICLNCGYVLTGTSAPELCPACIHPKAYYALNCEAY